MDPSGQQGAPLPGPRAQNVLPAEPRPRCVCSGSAGREGRGREKEEGRAAEGGGGACLACQGEGCASACEPGARAATALRQPPRETWAARAPLVAVQPVLPESPRRRPRSLSQGGPVSGPLGTAAEKEGRASAVDAPPGKDSKLCAPRPAERSWLPPASHVSKALAAPRAWAPLLPLRGRSSPDAGVVRLPGSGLPERGAGSALPARRVCSWRLPPGVLPSHPGPLPPRAAWKTSLSLLQD